MHQKQSVEIRLLETLPIYSTQTNQQCMSVPLVYLNALLSTARALGNADSCITLERHSACPRRPAAPPGSVSESAAGHAHVKKSQKTKLAGTRASRTTANHRENHLSLKDRGIAEISRSSDEISAGAGGDEAADPSRLFSPVKEENLVGVRSEPGRKPAAANKRRLRT